MLGLIPGMRLFLLQEQFFKDDNPTEALIVVIAFGIILIIAFIFRLLGKGLRQSAPVGKGKNATTAPRNFGFFTLHRIAKTYGLDRNQTKFLEFVFRNDGVSDPIRVMQTPNLLDRHFKRTYRLIDKNSKTDEDAQQNLEKLFSLRNVIEAGPDMGEDAQPRLTEKTPAILVTGKENFSVKVITSRGVNVVVEVPRNSLGTPIRLSHGTRISLSFFTKSSSGFSLDGQIMGPVNTDFGQGLQIKHTGKPKPLVKRKYRRAQTDIKCEFFLVNVVESGTGRKKTSKLVVDNRKFKGSVQDISAGGCSLRTSVPVPIGSRLKLAIDHDENYLINVLGQVIRTNRSVAGTIIHIKFLKVPRRAFNSISALVFGYNDT